MEGGKYQPVVYESGSGDLKESILGLLQHNREVIAKREWEEEKGHKTNILWASSDNIQKRGGRLRPPRLLTLTLAMYSKTMLQ